ncbi:MAG TPA: UTP--glucose-1-phosphate uridylyltransferase [Patescibacteria group bacterium]|nr:UTP--glucose-1-phosphate uridylyltransferase [Patescibacteria group bacterium]
MTQKKITKIVFPAAGLATRFLPATKTVPKELFPLVDKPLLQYAVEEAKEAGIDEFIFVISARKDAIRQHFAREEALEQYLADIGKQAYADIIRACALPDDAVHIIHQDEPRGLGHAVWLARDVVGDAPFAVLLPDDAILAKTGALKQMVDFGAAHPGSSLVAAQDVAPEQVHMYGVIDGAAEYGHLRVRSLVEKPSREAAPSATAIIGRYILQPEIFGILDKMVHAPRGKGEIQLTDAISELAATAPVYGFRFDGRRYDCGHCAGLIEAAVAFALQRPDIAPGLREKLAALL